MAGLMRGSLIPDAVLFRPDDRAFIVAAENQMHVARLINKIDPRLHEPFGGGARKLSHLRKQAHSWSNLQKAAIR